MRLSSLALRVAAPCVRCFPGTSRVLARLAARTAWRLRPITRSRVVRNLLPACNGDRAHAREASRKVFENVALYYLEALTLPSLNVMALEANRLEVVNPEHLTAIPAVRPVVIVSAHMGNPELAIHGLLGRDRPFAAIVEPLADRSFAHRFLGLRRSAGSDFVEATPGGLLHAVRLLRGGGVVALLGDRDIQHNGICVSLLGRRAHLPRGPWDLARRSDAWVSPGFCFRLPDRRIRVTFEAPFTVDKTPDAEGDIVTAAQRWAKLFESHLRSDPGQWVVLEDFWANYGCTGHARA